jgi:hypothetical protein
MFGSIPSGCTPVLHRTGTSSGRSTTGGMRPAGRCSPMISAKVAPGTARWIASSVGNDSEEVCPEVKLYRLLAVGRPAIRASSALRRPCSARNRLKACRRACAWGEFGPSALRSA